MIYPPLTMLLNILTYCRSFRISIKDKKESRRYDKRCGMTRKYVLTMALLVVLIGMLISAFNIQPVKSEPEIGKGMCGVSINDLYVDIEYWYSYNDTAISNVTIEFTVYPRYWADMPNFYIDYVKFSVMDISAPLTTEYSYDFTFASAVTLLSPNNITTKSSGIVPKLTDFPPHYIRVDSYVKFRYLESSEWTWAVIPFTLHFRQYDFHIWNQIENDYNELKNDYNDLKHSIAGLNNLMYFFVGTTIIFLIATAFFGFEWWRHRKLLKSP